MEKVKELMHKVECQECFTKSKVYNRLEVLNVDKADDFQRLNHKDINQT
jgi:hypothetical protein